MNRRSLTNLPATGPAPPLVCADTSLVQRFESQAERHGARTAIDGAAWRPGYAELNAAANRLAHALLSRGGSPGDRAALLMRHDAPLISGVLAVLKTGKTAMVIHPHERLEQLRRLRAHAEPALVITDIENRKLAAGAGFSCAQTLVFGEGDAGFPETNPGLPVPPEATAFLVYTSGSTSKPKGVMQTHRQIAQTVHRYTRGLGYTAADRFLLLGSLSWGQGVATAMTALLNGATLCPFSLTDRGLPGLAPWLRKHRVTVFISAASIFRNFLTALAPDDRFPDIRVVRLGAEAVRREDFDSFCRHFDAQCLFVNALSSSEAGNITQHLVTRDSAVPDRGPLPVGKPADDIEVLLMDESGAPVPRGTTGEIVVRSASLSAGYWKNETLTAQRFFPDPSGQNMKLFYSGDLGMFREDGALILMGRKDGQAKVRGLPVDLREIEAALNQMPQISQAAVVLRQSPGGHARLVACVESRRGTARSPSALRTALLESFPQSMVPAKYIFFDHLPELPDGGIDREALSRAAPAPITEPLLQQPEPQLPVTTENSIARFWLEALNRSRVDLDDDFFSIGGDSLSAMTLLARIHDAWGVEVGMTDFAKQSTIRALAQLVDALGQTRLGSLRPQLIRVPRDGPLPISLPQEHTWRSCQTPGGAAGYTRAVSIAIRGPLDVEALGRSLSYIVQRHEILRTTFEERDGRPLQVIRPPRPVDLPLIDLAHSPDASERAAALLHEDAQTPLDPVHGPLVGFRLVRMGENDFRLLRRNHHLISDRWSWNVFYQEFAELYDPFRRGEPPPLPPELALQYADFAAWQRIRLGNGGSEYREQIRWWKQRLQHAPPPLELHFRRAAAVPDAPLHDGFVRLDLPPDLSENIARLGRSQDATLFNVCLAAFAAQLAIENGVDDVVLGTYVTNRDRIELQQMIGMFANLVPLRLPFTGNLTFRQWLSTVRQAVLETQDHGEISYQQLCDELRNEKLVPPEIRVLFTLADDAHPARIADLEIGEVARARTSMPWGFGVSVGRSPNGDSLRAGFDARIYDPAAVRAGMVRLRDLLAAVTAAPDQPLRELLRPGGDD